jgi:hypothetical protein
MSRFLDDPCTKSFAFVFATAGTCGGLLWIAMGITSEAIASAKYGQDDLSYLAEEVNAACRVSLNSTRQFLGYCDGLPTNSSASCADLCISFTDVNSVYAPIWPFMTDLGIGVGVCAAVFCLCVSVSCAYGTDTPSISSLLSRFSITKPAAIQENRRLLDNQNPQNGLVGVELSRV